MAVPSPGTLVRLVRAPGVDPRYWENEPLVVAALTPLEYSDRQRRFPRPEGFFAASARTGNRVGWVEIGDSEFDVYDALGTTAVEHWSYGQASIARRDVTGTENAATPTNPRSGRVFDTSVIETRQGFVGQVRLAHSGKIVWESEPVVDEPDEAPAQLRARELADQVIDEAIATLFRSALPGQQAKKALPTGDTGEVGAAGQAAAGVAQRPLVQDAPQA